MRSVPSQPADFTFVTAQLNPGAGIKRYTQKSKLETDIGIA